MNRFLRVRSLRSITFAALICCALVTGCTLSLPVKLTELTDVHDTLLSETRSPSPRLTFQLHPDGLGWQVFVSEQVDRYVASEGNEYWRYRAYDLSGHGSPERPVHYDDLCGILLLTTPLLAPFTVEEPPYWSRWDRLIPACGDVGNPGGFESVLRNPTRFREYHHVDTEAVTDSHLVLTWQAVANSSFQIEVPLTAGSRLHGTTVRLRWIAQLLQQRGYDVSMMQGSLRLDLVRRSKAVVQRVLPVQADDLAASLKDSQFAMASPVHWPRPLAVRIERDPDPLTQAERVHLLIRTSAILNRLAIPIVLRGSELEDWRAEQIRTHQPAFQEIPSVDPAHLSGANVLLHMEVRTPYEQSRSLTMYLIGIGTGEILAKLSVEGHESHWPTIVERVVTDLDFIMRYLLQNLPVQRAGGRSIQESESRLP